MLYIIRKASNCESRGEIGRYYYDGNQVSQYYQLWLQIEMLLGEIALLAFGHSLIDKIVIVGFGIGIWCPHWNKGLSN